MSKTARDAVWFNWWIKAHFVEGIVRLFGVVIAGAINVAAALVRAVRRM
jgi:hypothetical protein